MSVNSPVNEKEMNFNNALRCLNQLEKAVDRLARAHYYSQEQWPQTMVLLNDTINDIYIWIQNIKAFELVD